MSHRLTELRPAWFALEGRQGQGVAFDCTCGCAGTPRAIRLAVIFSPALDGGPPLTTKVSEQYRALHHTFPEDRGGLAPSGIVWQRTAGSSFEDLTLYPSVNYEQCGHCHVTIVNGLVLP